MKNKQGFTLIELLSVVLIIAILTAVGLPQYRRVVDKARVSEAQAMLGSINDSAERVAGEFGYRSFTSFAANEPSKAVFKRLDMFDKDSLPAGCTGPGLGISSDGKQLNCVRFNYKLPSGDYVKAQVVKEGRLKGMIIALNTKNMTFYCGGSEDNCEAVGLDYKSGLGF